MTYPKTSRYHDLPLRSVPGPDGPPVTVVEAPRREEAPTRGWHRYQPGQRLDLLGNAYCGAPQAWWRIPDHMNVLWPDALTEEDEIAIPDKGGAR
ncbi:hypothetical protein ACN2XU_09050 [Primorskyibacter sp. 2E107]|uniref:hypothetical protein n=1 Tax=Primorskyibacter sp. 2E107 TaxID=3403458 RepID=UPI003AF5B188